MFINLFDLKSYLSCFSFYEVYSSSYYLIFCTNLFSKYVGYLGIFIGLIVFFISYEKFKYQKLYYSIFYLVFGFIVFGLINTVNIFYFFIFYELLFFPSFILVYNLAPNRRGIFASHYFFL